MRALTFFLSLLTATNVLAQLEVNERVGYARDVNTDTLLYTESHYETYDNGIIISDRVTYADADGNVFAEKEVDYSQNRFMPDFNLENNETGHREIVNKRDTELEVIFTPNEQSQTRRNVIALPENGIIDAGFDQFVVQHWDTLTDGKKLVRKMLIPSMKKFIDFRIYQESIDEQRGKRTLKVEPDSALLRFLADPLVLEYGMDSPRLYVFTGTSNMRDASGDNLQVTITFPEQEYRITRK